MTNNTINTLFLSGVAILTLFTTGCAPKGLPTTGYNVRMSDGWSSTNEHCHTYEKTGQHLKCYDESGSLVVELFMSDDIRFYIRAY